MPYNSFPQPASQQIMYWVQSEDEAKTLYVLPGIPNLMMDRNSNRFYIKIADGAGRIQSFQKFIYNEEIESLPIAETRQPDYDALCSEIEEFKAAIANLTPEKKTSKKKEEE